MVILKAKILNLGFYRADSLLLERACELPASVLFNPEGRAAEPFHQYAIKKRKMFTQWTASRKLLKIAGLFFAAVLLWLPACKQEPQLSFNKDIRPIFNAKCVGCHGGVKQAGGFGLVFRENALRETSSGKRAIVPGNAARSELVRRIVHDDPELRMPLEAAPLEEHEVALISEWIEQGAEWEDHWAYNPLTLPEVPETTEWSEQPIDRFVHSRLIQQNLAPSGRAKKEKLLRRVSFDLTGLPPEPEVATRFLEDDRPSAYADLVDTLLSRPTYGEHLASYWLDLARYANSRGYERDRLREIWPYRDWVIKAFNQDMPFDQFTVEQLAGDLLEQPTTEQLTATGFHRNTLSNGEGGTENEEYRTVTVMDRVNTTYEVWQGTTMSCVQCHSHPYDPIKHEEFYQAYALFNNTVDHDHITESPKLVTLHAADEQKYLRLQDWLQEEAKETQEYWRRWIKLREPRMRAYDLEEHNGVFTGRADEDYLYLRPGTYFKTPSRNLAEVQALIIDQSVLHPGTLVFRLDDENGPEIDRIEWTKKQRDKETRLELGGITGEHSIHVSVESEADEEAIIFRLYTVAYEDKLPGEDRQGYAEIKQFIQELGVAKDSFSTLVLAETPAEFARTTHLFERGNWLVHGPEMDGGQHENRLDFARWLVSEENPLTARVIVNRYWAQLFGRGIVSTVADFGSQGDLPAHPELLDYLAMKFSTEMNWQLKPLLKEIVLSQTYQQSSIASAQQLQQDPYNTWLARGPRKRLTGEQLRDQALAISGALSDKMYGPSVMPPQPDGHWNTVVHSRTKWVTSEGEDRYRRAVYTFLRRSALHPVMTTFDGAERDVCLSERVPTNTPLQALMTLNDPAFRELAGIVANSLLEETTLEKQMNVLFERVLYRRPSAEEIDVLKDLHTAALAHYQSEETDQAKREAMTIVVNAVLNLDESLNLT